MLQLRDATNVVKLVVLGPGATSLEEGVRRRLGSYIERLKYLQEDRTSRGERSRKES